MYSADIRRQKITYKLVRYCHLLFYLITVVSRSYGGEIHRVVFTPPQGMTRAEVVYLVPPKYPKGFLALGPGYTEMEHI